MQPYGIIPLQTETYMQPQGDKMKKETPFDDSKPTFQEKMFKQNETPRLRVLVKDTSPEEELLNFPINELIKLIQCLKTDLERQKKKFERTTKNFSRESIEQILENERLLRENKKLLVQIEELERVPSFLQGLLQTLPSHNVTVSDSVFNLNIEGGEK